MIIVEGCDNTGKSTLVELLLRRHSKLVLGPKRVGPPEDKQTFIDEIWETLSNAERLKNVIFDRLYFSELVYGRVLRGKPFISYAEQKMIDQVLRYCQPLIIYCYQDPAIIRETFAERDQLPGEDKIEEILNEYTNVFLPWANYRDFHIYDYRNPLSVAKIMGRVKEYVKSRVEHELFWGRD